MQWLLVISLCVFLLTSCRPALDKKIVGRWMSGCSVDICTITTLRPDRTFSYAFEEDDRGDSLSGTWHVERNQLVLHVTWADNSLQHMVGKDFRLLISQLQHDTLVATSVENKTKAVTWERRH
jgi:hypothetical protein